MTNLTLWQMTDRYLQALQALSDDDDLPPEVVRDTLDALGGDLQVKAGNVATYIRMLDTETEAIKAEIDRLRALEKRVDTHATRLRQYLLENMQRAGITRIEHTEAPFYRISIRRNPPRVVVDEETFIPAEFVRTKVVEDIDKTAIKAAIQAGQDVPGAHLEQNERLDIR